jgi:hypothetical protein
MGSPSLETLLQTLAASDVELIVVGMLAAVAQGAPVTTHELDIVHRRTPDNIARLLAVLGDLDARYRGHGEKVLRPAASRHHGLTAWVACHRNARGAHVRGVSSSENLNKARVAVAAAVKERFAKGGRHLAALP